MAEQSIYPFSLTVSAADIAPLKGFAEKSGLPKNPDLILQPC